MSTIGQRISELRKSNSYSQEYIAEKLNVSRQAVSKWEQDLSAPDTYNLIALAELFGVSVEYLATGKLREQAVQAAPVEQKEKSRITARQILGIVLVGLGILAVILGIIIEEILIIIGIYLAIVGTVCIAAKKHFVLCLLWTLLAPTLPLTFMLLPVAPYPDQSSGRSISIAGIFTILIIGLLIITVILTVIEFARSRRNK